MFYFVNTENDYVETGRSVWLVCNIMAELDGMSVLVNNAEQSCG